MSLINSGTKISSSIGPQRLTYLCHSVEDESYGGVAVKAITLHPSIFLTIVSNDFHHSDFKWWHSSKQIVLILYELMISNKLKLL